MTMEQYKLVLVSALIMAVGIGCSIFDKIPLDQIGTAAGEIAETTAAMGNSVNGEAGNTLKIVSIISNAISTLAFGLLMWGVKRNKPKGE